ncbi:hypothetical protein HOLleu_27528 [Holothuria leucospilota]|uniref:Integrase core domain-containing protein n=1 Tax=Holothuria leucospilota TaxID=206669 RepID=A0A9Q1BQ26_HOLLE|nr:hypothetical protein HOLleu_27528 [Holothuria leucospilota]
MDDYRMARIRLFFRLGLTNDEILIALSELDNIELSKRHLKRLMNSEGLFRRKHHSNYLADVALYVISELERFGQLHGYRWFHHKLRNNGYNIDRETVRRLLLLFDPDGVELRRRRRLRRRNYNGIGPNFVWHIDSYDKLKHFGICINGCIDGFSRYILWLEAYKSSSDPRLIAGYYMNTVDRTGGCPTVVRADLGTENSSVRDMQIFLRRNGRDRHAAERSFLYGRSTSNQRIEFWWSILRKQCADFWINLFGVLRDIEAIFDGGDLDKALIQFCFMSIIQEELDNTVLQWSTHRISPSRLHPGPFGRPVMMYISPRSYGTRDYLHNVERDELEVCLEECRFKDGFPCCQEVFDVCCVIMNEQNLLPPSSPSEAVELYQILRQALRNMLRIR